MTLNDLKEQFKNKKIEKQEYINKISESHKILYSYKDFITSTDIEKIEINKNYLLFYFPFNSIKLIQKDFDIRAIPQEVLNFDSYEKEDFNFFLEITRNIYKSFEKKIDNNYFLDIGANIGWYSINISKMFEYITPISFEPIPSIYELLKDNIKINKLDKNILPLNIGLSDKSGNIEFFYDKNFTSCSSLKNITNNINSEKVLCKIEKIDDLVILKNKTVEIIKIDTEGSELFALLGGINTIKRDKPFIMSEILRKWSKEFNYHPNDILNLLFNIGYKCFAINNGIIEIKEVDNNTIPTNFFFLHTDKHSNEINKIFSKMI